jgi:hypothetical protein
VGRETESFRNREGLRATRRANDKSICRSQGHKIKLNRAVNDSIGNMGVLLQFRIVTRREQTSPAEAEVINDRCSKRRPFCRIRTCARFIKEDQIARLCVPLDAQDGGEVP